MLRRLAAGAASAMFVAGLVQLSPAAAANFTVNNAGDAGDLIPGNGTCSTLTNVCTLRAAIQEANALAGSDVITIPAMTIGLASELPTLTGIMTIQGAGARSTILTGNGGAHRMLVVAAGSVTVSGLTITGVTGGAGALGLMQNGGAVILDKVRVTGINASGVGAIYGPVYADGGTLTVRDSEIAGNTTTSTGGSAWGGAMALYSATATVINSTFADNLVTGSTGAHGAGLWAGQNSVASITSSTIAGNSRVGPGFGGAIFQNSGGTGSVEVQSSVLTAAPGSTPCTAGGISKLPQFLGQNIVQDTSCGAASAARTVGDPALTALADNGGPTNTRSPGAGSPAIDAIVGCAPSSDQRGRPRPVGSGCDLGAVEVSADIAADVSVSNTAPSAGSDVVVTATARNIGPDRGTGTTVSVQVAGASQVLSASGPCTVTGPTVSCAVGDLASAGTFSTLLTVRMPASGPVSVKAAATAAQPDPDTGNNSATASAQVAGSGQPTPQPQPEACSIVRNGTAQANVFTGSANGDRISGKGGNDRIDGRAGQDCLSGGKGNDRLIGGDDADQVLGGAGKDRISVRDGVADRVNCGLGLDTVIADRMDSVRKCEVVRRK